MSHHLPSEFGANRSLGGYSEDFADDDGSPDPQVRSAMTAAEGSPEAAVYLEAVVQLCLSRLLVPLLASGDETTHHDPERQAEMSAVFLDSLTAWNALARPVPATLDVVADAATQSAAGTVLIDIAGPHPLIIEGGVLENLALSRRLVRLPDQSFGWLAPAAQDPDSDPQEQS
ncbi:MAG: hypothetical protein Q4F67_02135 [Propionibacteriaceae bacterium]|nr:hypothetical protein [Propionibacteriaceae bacterium]